jgi:MYXO-CTERM domain-containing protein
MTGTGASGNAGGFGIPSPDGGVVPVDAGVDGGSHGGKHSGEHDSGGCGCRVGATRTPDSAAALLLVLGIGALLRRRRSSLETGRL